MTPLFVLLGLVPVAMFYRFSAGSPSLIEALFFTKVAFLTLGGVFAVLAYIAQAGVEQYLWLTGPVTEIRGARLNSQQGSDISNERLHCPNILKIDISFPMW